MAKKAAAGSNQPPIIVKKIIMEEHAGHHGGAWKVAYADFVTAMMAFFLLMWLLGATNEKQRKALADYFAPTLVDMQRDGAGSDGLFGGSSLIDEDNYPHKASQTGSRSLTIPNAATSTKEDKGKGKNSERSMDAKEFEKKIRERLESNPDKQVLLKNIRFTDTDEGLRIDLIDEANFSI